MLEMFPHYEFSEEKDLQLIKQRGIGCREIIAAINRGAVLAVTPHPNKDKYPNQKIYVVNINGYAYFVPFVRKDENSVFLKTIFPSRKLTKRYLQDIKNEKRTHI